MLWNAKNGYVTIGDTKMNYVSFGYGEKILILIPGLSDGLMTVKGKALLLAKPYRLFFKKYTVYMFSRKDVMPDGYSIRDMAHDQVKAMLTLSIEKASIMGVSQGGMIAQYMAIDHPELVDKLILAVTAPRVNNGIKDNVIKWIDFAQQGNHKALMIDTAEKGYSSNYLKKYRTIYPVVGFIGKPKTYDRFLINANAILQFNAYNEINEITCPTLIIGGDEDKTVGVEASYELNQKIKDSELYIYCGLGHAAYEEAKDFNQRVYDFLEK
ncbi:MAG: alpha/beta hydrolase [Erysipelotrichaceae bacterium]|nr:alpha/beta hydrolase [Erysipelotrichaceae bacterium]